MRNVDTFFLRVAARCNFDCDYCYVFKHSDTSWLDMPPRISPATVSKFADRLSEYLGASGLDKVNVIFHGGEPLFVGKNNLIEIVDIIVNACKDRGKVSFSLQTNGSLIDADFLEECEKRNVGISLSIDGSKEIHNKHRKYPTGEGTFDHVMRAVGLLKKHPNIFEGVIGVIDPYCSPETVLEFYDSNGLLDMDLLLPDSNYTAPPSGRTKDNPSLYSNWLIRSFDFWFYKYQRLRFRTFEHVLQRLLGINIGTDMFGLGELDYITIETDGSYHTSDIMKSTYKNASAMGLTIFDTSITEALKSPKFDEFNRLLSFDSLPQKCKLCEFGHECGGGSLPHRYSAEKGFSNPSIYCEEMLCLFNHARDVLSEEISKEKIRE